MLLLFLISLFIWFKQLPALNFLPDSSDISSNQNQSSIFISEIKIIGNEKTRPEIVLFEMKIKPKSFATIEEIEYDIDRIMGLGIFSDVNYKIDKNSDEYILYIIVRESWYIFPLPFVDIEDRDWKKLSYGIFLLIKNLSGKNDRLSSGFSLGYDPSFYLSYSDLYYDFEKNLGFKFLLQSQKRKNKSIRALRESNGENYHEDYFQLEFTLRKRVNLYTNIFGSLGYEYIHVPKYYPLRTLSSDGTDRLLTFQLSYSYDVRDFIAYPKKGYFLLASIKHYGLSKSLIDYTVLNLDLKKAYSISPITFYLRNYLRTVIGSDIPYYANSFLGFGDRLRGRFDEIYESNALNLFSFEMRFPLIDKYLLQFDLPIIPTSLTTYNILVDFHLFYDSAFMWDINDRITSRRLINGAGVGFTFFVLPYRGLNFEIGFSPERKPEFIVDLLNPL